MKKLYIAPQTEAITVIANGVLMASPGGGYTDPHLNYGGGSGSGFGGN
jgi:hypothetical protein